ncbi:MAG: ATP-dependent DNA helicase RecQ [Acidobacteria bacterium]|nr:ATP-dependent DNA helicase RecQ [Acidobacteriota bacterium]
MIEPFTALKEIWGYESFRPHQQEVVESVINGRDTMTILPTGGGKSLCYQIPAVLMKGTAVVISPLISLMQDQVTSLQLLGIPSGCLNSAQNADAAKQVYRELMRGQLKLLYISPERAAMPGFSEILPQIDVSFLAVDEAHCISQWGHDFRPEYRQLASLRTALPDVGMHAFTATATPEVRRDIADQLSLQSPLVLVGDYFRANLTYRAHPRHNIANQLESVMASHNPMDLGIVYCLTRKETERIAAKLQQKGYSALPYHAGLDHETREHNQRAFAEERAKIMVATVAFGMGIDQSNVRFVVHTGMPRSLAHYLQESGRAGRDGLPAQCTLFYSEGDIMFWRTIIDHEPMDQAPRLRQLHDMSDYAYRVGCRHQILVEYFGQPFHQSPCHACDYCLGELASIPESRRVSRMILSAVLKTGQQFGAGYVAQVLSGSRDARIVANQHTELSVHNLLGQYAKTQIHDWINQLAQQGYLQSTGNAMPIIKMHERGYWLLRPDKFGKEESELPVTLIATRSVAKTPKETPTHGALYDRLRQERREIAAESAIPAYMVCGDRSLQDLARKQPTDRPEFLKVFGMGPGRWERFGPRFIAVIQEFLSRHDAQGAASSQDT